ncbi:flavohemoglobin expression-modulating QEGLA motif protein [uncultured Paraglaciecola sp.]|uniref:flavohemoglobin expression-modulating QEGLA motif protein n=1 Tax=uncultured Paraglaciecola sp. TaxID=1765024 RepID=UPI0025DB8D98|nr:flavohemoglobin expression-modulating QEGLA motif protein [uncultured Paraglaciecola sp.]
MNLEAEKQHICHVSAILYTASQSIRILSHIEWNRDVKRQFFAEKSKALPKVTYPEFDPANTISLVAEARKLLGNTDIDQWLERIAIKLEYSALMMASTGSNKFYEFSEKLYGKPTNPFVDGKSTPLDLANTFDKQISSYANYDMGAPAPMCYLASGIADQMQAAVIEMFGDEAPKIEIVDELSANALASPKLIRIRKTACFTDLDAQQLINHEAHIHVATSINGLNQPHLKILAAGHPGTTKTQEGLAVFSEYITNSIDLDRLRRLADRIIAIQMAIEGANFLEVYQYFLGRIGSESQAYENSRRVFRGGVLTGGAPFTKDGVYLEGLIRVHNFLKAIAANGRADCLKLLFCGKLDIEDIPVLYKLEKMGLCKPAKYLPPWVKDARYLLAYLTCSGFLNKMDVTSIYAHYDDLLHSIPKTGV